MGITSKDEERIRTSVMRMVNRYAKRSPIFLNPDKVVVKNIIEGLVRNKIKYGYAYCPCREIKSIPEGIEITYVHAGITRKILPTEEPANVASSSVKPT